jgi:hypothetical protein
MGSNAPAVVALPSKFGPKGRGWPESDPFWYPLNPPTLANGATNVQAQLQLNTDYDFLWDRISCSSATLFSVYFTDGSRGVPLLGNQGVPLLAPNIGQSPGGGTLKLLQMWLPKPYRLRRGTIISALFNNLAGRDITVQVVLGGRNVS